MKLSEMSSRNIYKNNLLILNVFFFSVTFPCYFLSLTFFLKFYGNPTYISHKNQI